MLYKFGERKQRGSTSFPRHPILWLLRVLFPSHNQTLIYVSNTLFQGCLLKFSAWTQPAHYFQSFYYLGHAILTAWRLFTLRLSLNSTSFLIPSHQNEMFLPPLACFFYLYLACISFSLVLQWVEDMVLSSQPARLWRAGMTFCPSRHLSLCLPYALHPMTNVFVQQLCVYHTPGTGLSPLI